MFEDLIEKTVALTGKQITQDRASTIVIDQNTAHFVIKIKGAECHFKRFYKEGIALEKIVSDLKEIHNQLIKTFEEKNLK